MPISNEITSSCNNDLLFEVILPVETNQQLHHHMPYGIVTYWITDRKHTSSLIEDNGSREVGKCHHWLSPPNNSIQKYTAHLSSSPGYTLNLLAITMSELASDK